MSVCVCVCVCPRQGDKDSGGNLAGQLEEAAQIVKYVYSQCPSYDQLIPALLQYPVSVSLLGSKHMAPWKGGRRGVFCEARGVGEGAGGEGNGPRCHAAGGL